MYSLQRVEELGKVSYLPIGEDLFSLFLNLLCFHKVMSSWARGTACIRSIAHPR